MRDQAERLRIRLKQQESTVQTKTIAVISGKGGVGKSNFSLNFAISLKDKGHSVLIFDMDIGMGNIDVLMGYSSAYSIADFFTNNVPLSQIITEVPGGIHYISGGSGLSQLTKITPHAFQDFLNQFSLFLSEYDFIILDMDAGMNENSLRFVLSVDEVIVMTTPEPTSITDAYAAMKYITLQNNTLPFYIVVNRVQSHMEGIATFNRISKVLMHFLDKDASFLGMIPDDNTIPQAVRKQIPFTYYNEKAPASKALKKIIDKYFQQDFSQPFKMDKSSFVSKLKRFLFER